MVKVVLSPVSPVAEAPMVSEPALPPAPASEPTPLTAVAEPRPLTVPVPAVLAKPTEVVLSLSTRLPAASRISTVRVRLAPEIDRKGVVQGHRGAAGRWTMVKVVLSPVSPVAEAPMGIEPARTPVTDLEATPLTAVAEPRPLTVPVPAVLAKPTEVVLSLSTRLPAASRISTVRVRLAPE